MAESPKELEQMLKSECGHTIEELIARKSAYNVAQLNHILKEDHSKDSVLLNNTIHVLGRWKDKKAMPKIVHLLPSLDERGLINALSALGQIGGREAFETITRYETHASSDVRRFVVSALSQIGDKDAMAEVAKMAASDEVSLVQKRAKQLLERAPHENQ